MPVIRTHEEIVALAKSNPKLRSLEVANGGLSTLPEELDAFKLTKLVLYTNEFQSLPEPVRRQTRLKSLSIKTNPLPRLPPWLPELKELREVSVTYGELREASFKGFRHLETIDLSFNPVRRLELEDLPALRELSLANHELDELPAWLASCRTLEMLYVTNRRLSALPALGPALRSLTLNGCGLAELPEWLAEAKNLTLLHASDNPFQRTPPTALPALESLFLTRCGLRQVPELVVRSPRLRYLRLDGNHLSELPEGLARVALELVDLAGNNLTTLPSAMADMPRLRRLDLSHNPIRQWPSFPPPAGLRELHLRGSGLESLRPPDAWRALAEAGR